MRETRLDTFPILKTKTKTRTLTEAAAEVRRQEVQHRN